MAYRKLFYHPFFYTRSNTMNSLVTRGSLLDDFFKDIAPGFYVRPLHGEGVPSPSQIKVDVKETDAGYTVNAEIPGVSRQDIHVSVENNVVSLSAEVRQHDEKREGERVLRSERYFGSVSRSFQLPGDVDAGRAKAKYDNGVLVLTLPKKVGTAGQRLNIE
jgi:HSP20 family protein